MTDWGATSLWVLHNLGCSITWGALHVDHEHIWYGKPSSAAVGSNTTAPNGAIGLLRVVLRRRYAFRVQRLPPKQRGQSCDKLAMGLRQ